MPRKHESLPKLIERIEAAVEHSKSYGNQVATLFIDDIERLIIAAVDGDDVA